MKLLALDTCLDTFSLGLYDSQTCLAEIQGGQPRTHLIHLYPALQQALLIAGQSLDAIEAVCVTQGPGSFTGVRLGILLARSLGLVRGLPVVGCHTLEVLAMNTPGQGYVEVAVDARKGEILSAAYQVTWDGLVCLRPPALMRPEQWRATTVAAGPVLGNALARYADFVPAGLAVTPPDLWQVRAGNVARMGLARLQTRSGQSWQQVLPIYLREPDVHT